VVRQVEAAPTESANPPPETGEPIFDIADTKALVLQNSALNRDYIHMILQADGCAADAKAGQFFNIACPASADDIPYLRRPMSVYRASPKEGRVEFLYKVTGAGTRGLATLRPGDRVAILGPLGQGFTLDPAWKSIVVLARGVGLATLAPLAELAAANRIGVTAMLSVRARDVVMSVERFAASGARIEILTDEEGSSDPQNVEHMLLQLVEARQADAFFTCGSQRLMILMKRIAAMHKIPGQVALEQQMACGLGMCFCCVRNFETREGFVQRRVCCEGPVFDLAEALAW